MVFDWNDEKNTLLKESRNVCFEDVVTSIQDNKLLDIVKNPSANHQGQYCLIVEIMNYAYIVPFVKEGDTFFLKTIYPSRKETKKYFKE
ncbi:MAG: toxin [Sulfuricurvum sp.]|uniref:toxin n=1 Tax=Sulfuricurvum sp. TaxID=2025608 RepID=UPI002632F5FA|nr:toxin [Sulfuricurvum sp.]MDD2828869.1 toxin [Sulfuricurvum sp.]MDD4948532.1 toxin [Sulfuricurvum sp.]